MQPRSKFAIALHARRVEREMTQAQAAHECNVWPEQYTRWETGKVRPMGSVDVIAEFMGLTCKEVRALLEEG